MKNKYDSDYKKKLKKGKIYHETISFTGNIHLLTQLLKKNIISSQKIV